MEINAVLCFLLVVSACGGAFIWNEPKAARMLAKRLTARAAGLDASRAAYREAVKAVYLEEAK